jgi:glycerol-3-phosphate dehydrogenase (NAD(P)+)
MNIGILGSGSWGTALAKILTDNGQHIRWWNRNEKAIDYLRQRRHNPHYLSTVYFDTSKISLTHEAEQVVRESDHLVVAVPSSYVAGVFEKLDAADLTGKKVISAVKGMLPQEEELLNDHLSRKFRFPLNDYFAILGPCHAEEVAAEKLSYLTFSGIDTRAARHIADQFTTPYLNTVVNGDIYGVQFAAILKNIYALGAGIAHGLEYGDNFLSVLIANSAAEMNSFLTLSRSHYPSGKPLDGETIESESKGYGASVYLGDLLVTCYSLFSRNRTFGNMIGKGYSVKAATMEMNMVAEGFNASKCVYRVNRRIGASMPIAETVYRILWEQLPASVGFEAIEKQLV